MMTQTGQARKGFTLLELLIVLSLTALLMLGLVQMVTAASASSRLQENQAHIQDRSRYATRLFREAISQAGYNPRPWEDRFTLEAIGEATADSVSGGNDRLVVRAWSDLNCFDNRNPVKGPDGRPAFYVRETLFDVNSSRHLTRDCRYGPTLSDMTTQVRRQGLIPGIESFQLLFGEAGNGSDNIGRWAHAGAWADKSRILGVRVGILLRSEDPVSEAERQELSILDRQVTPPADGRLRQALQFAVSIRSQTG
jgi:prepilin-type N-terminal cleavage/methylation domain-containing protein